jgi:RimJ/RimL family protein N-acetyltransferase
MVAGARCQLARAGGKDAMKKPNFPVESITIREVESSDLDTFYVQQLDPEAIRMAAFVSEDRKDKAAFDAHWKKILNSSQNTNRTIVADGQVAGHIACFPHGENLEVTYWLGREFWGKGIATQALTRMLQLIVARPILGRAATDNIGSIRVLQKCGFKIIGKDKGFADGRREETEEYILRLDLAQANE